MNRRTEPSPAALAYAIGHVEFALWLDAIDRAVNARLGVSIFDLEDINYRDEYEAGATDHEVVMEIMDHQGEF